MCWDCGNRGHPPPMTGLVLRTYPLTHFIGSHHFMENRWGNSGNSDIFCFLGSKITADGDCSHEIKRHLFLGRKTMTKLDSILRSRDITLATKVHIVKTMLFPIVMYGYESCFSQLVRNISISAF